VKPEILVLKLSNKKRRTVKENQGSQMRRMKLLTHQVKRAVNT
jgi:hypothetical protein